MAKPIIVANWKMHPASRRAAKQLFAATRKIASKASSLSIIVAPPALYLSELGSAYQSRVVQLAAQHAHEGAMGAFTGEVSMVQVKDSKARYVLVGHAERRGAGESDDDTRRQVLSALETGLAPILCVGERVRSASGEHLAFVQSQLRIALSEVSPEKLPRCMVAYEPVWAIGADTPMSPRQMHEMAIFIRKQIVEMHGEKGYAVKILYGGAIGEHTARPMLQEGEVQGLLVGRASTDEKEFVLLINAVTAKV